MTDTLQMRKVISLKGQVEVVTGLHIGAGKESVEIGGMDQPVIKDPASGEPYIPGSSLKGKMRSLLEWKLDGKLDAGGKVHSCTDPDCVICRIFGSTTESDGRGPTRLVVRDCPLSAESQEAFKKGRALLETKYENTINRVIGKAGNPRPLERVVPGTKFDFEILYRVLDDADEANFRIVLEGLEALERDYLGGCGSRGSGQVRILIKQDGSEYESLSDYLARLG